MGFVPDAPTKISRFVPDVPVKSGFVPDEPGLMEKAGNIVTEAISAGKNAASNVMTAPSRFIERSTPNPPLIPDTLGPRPQKNILGQVLELPMEQLFPMATSAREGNIPLVSDVFPSTRGIVPKAIRPPVEFAGGGLDTFFNIARLLPPTLERFFGARKGIPFSNDIRQAIEKNDLFADRVIRADAKALQPDIDAAIANGMNPKLVHGLVMTRLAILGSLMDAAEGFGIEAAMSAPGRFSRALQRSARLLDPKDGALAIRAAQLEERAMREFEKVGGDPNQLRLPGPGQAEPIARPSVAERAGKVQVLPEEIIPTAGPGFVIDQPRPGAMPIQQPVQDIFDLPARPAPVIPRQVEPSPGQIVDVAAEVQKRVPSREARIQAARQGAVAERVAGIEARQASERAFPPGPEMLPSAQPGARPPAPRGQVGPIAGRGFVIEEPKGFAERFVEKQGAPRQYGKGGVEPSVEAKRRLDAAAREDMERRVREGAIEAKFAREQGQFPALPAPKAAPKAPSAVERGPVAGEKFVIGGEFGPGAGGKKPSVRKNIIEISAEARGKQPRQAAIEKAAGTIPQETVAKAERAAKAAKAKTKVKKSKGLITIGEEKEPLSRLSKKLRSKKGEARLFDDTGKPLPFMSPRINAALSKLTAQERSYFEHLSETTRRPDMAAKKQAASDMNKLIGGVVKERVSALDILSQPSEAQKKFRALPKEVQDKYRADVSAAKKALGERVYPFKALWGKGKEELTVLGPADRFEPYKSAAKGRAEDVTQLLVTDSSGKRTLRMASDMVDKDTGGPLLPRPPVSDERGFLRFPKGGGGEAESPLVRRAKEKAKASQAARAARYAATPSKTATVGNIVDKKARVPISKRVMASKKKESEILGEIKVELPQEIKTFDAAGRPITKFVGGTKVGNTKVGEMVLKGELSERQAKILMVADRINPIISSKFSTTTRSERIAAIGNPDIRKVLEVVENMDHKSLAALHDTPVSQALAIAKRAQDQGVSIMNVMDEISQELLTARKVANVLGVNLNAIRNSAARGELADILEAHLRKRGITPTETAIIREALRDLGSRKARGRFRRTLDMITEYGINAMLSSPVTFIRNLAGSAAGVSFQVPTKIAQATVSNIAAMLRIPQTERAYFREVGPEIAGMIRGTIAGLRKGKRFLRHEDVKRVFESIENKITTLKAKEIPKGQAYSTLKRDQKARILRRLRADLRDLLTEEEVTRAAELGYPTMSRAIPGLLGKIINLPVRGLVATDKVFQTASATGHIAARRIRKAIQEKTSVRNIRLSADEIEEAKADALFYVFREKLGPKLGAFQNLISDTPLMPLIIPFLKSRINFIKFTLKNSPLGLIDTIWKSVDAGKLDTRSAAKTLAGTAALFGLWKFFDKNKDTIQLQPSARNAAEREALRESGIGEQVIIFGTNLNDPQKRKITHTEPYANMAPFSGPMEVVALGQEYWRRRARGYRADEAFAQTLNKGLRGVLNQSYFGGLRDTVVALENIADSKVAINADGTPEHGPVVSMLRGPAARVAYRRISGIAIPNIVRDVRNIMDKRILDPKTLGEQLRSELPRIGSFDPAKGIPARQTVFGSDALRTQKRLPFNPFDKAQKIDRTIEKMVQLEIFPTRAPKTLSLEGAPIVLTEDEQRQFNFLGPRLKKTLDGIVAMDGFDEMPLLAQKKILEVVVDNFRAVQLKTIKEGALYRLIQSDEGIQQIIQGVTEGFSPFK